MKLLSTIITVMILTLSVSVKSHSQINLFGLEINLFGPKQVELFGINSRMTDKEIMNVLFERDILCYDSEELGQTKCWKKEVIGEYDGYPFKILWDVSGHIVWFDPREIQFDCNLYSCRNTVKTVSEDLVRTKVLPSVEPRFWDWEIKRVVEQRPPEYDGLPIYCFISDSTSQRTEEVCIFPVFLSMKRYDELTSDTFR